MPIEKSKIVKETISNHIRNYLTTNNVKMTEFGRMLGVTRPAVKFWLEGRNIPDIELFPRLCEILDITIYELIGAKDPYKLNETQIEIVESYHNNENFRKLIDRYRSDESFRNKIDKIIEE